MEDQYWDCDHCEKRYPYEHEGYTPIEVGPAHADNLDHNDGSLWLCIKCANDWEERTAIHADDINRLNKPKGDE